jgi:hypothetical protein
VGAESAAVAFPRAVASLKAFRPRGGFSGAASRLVRSAFAMLSVTFRSPFQSLKGIDSDGVNLPIRIFIALPPRTGKRFGGRGDTSRVWGEVLNHFSLR